MRQKKENFWEEVVQCSMTERQYLFGGIVRVFRGRYDIICNIGILPLEICEQYSIQLISQKEFETLLSYYEIHILDLLYTSTQRYKEVGTLIELDLHKTAPQRFREKVAQLSKSR